jgi:hypothetical protein
LRHARSLDELRELLGGQMPRMGEDLLHKGNRPASFMNLV